MMRETPFLSSRAQRPAAPKPWRRREGSRSRLGGFILRAVRSTEPKQSRAAAKQCAAPRHARSARRSATLRLFFLALFLTLNRSFRERDFGARGRSETRSGPGARAGGETPGMGSPVPRGTRIETLSFGGRADPGSMTGGRTPHPALAVPGRECWTLVRGLRLLFRGGHPTPPLADPASFRPDAQPIGVIVPMCGLLRPPASQ